MADFTGFYLDHIHSSTYGILRTSDGDRYKESLIPDFEDSEVELVGGSGSLYAGRRFKTREFTIPIAFDNMSEQQMRDFRKWIGGEKLKALQFDERPYKTYWVKIQEAPELEYVCFLEDKGNFEKERVYKGEGELSFIAYDPFGYCIDESFHFENGELVTVGDGVNWQELQAYGIENLKDENMTEWALSSGLKNSLRGYNTFQGEKVNEQYEFIASLYNPGDFDVDFQLQLPILTSADYSLNEVTLYIYKNEPISLQDPDLQTFVFYLTKLSAGDIIFLDTKKHSLMINYKETELNSLRYDLVKSNNWPVIPTGEWKMKIEAGGVNSNFPFVDSNGDATEDNIKIKYNYKYY